jgi:hypothetical protein
MKTFQQILMEVKAERLKPQTIVGALKKAGQIMAITPKPKLRIPGRSGIIVRKVNAVVVAVSYQTWEGEAGKFDFKALSNKLEPILKNAGFLINRPYPDKTILAVSMKKA